MIFDGLHEEYTPPPALRWLDNIAAIIGGAFYAALFAAAVVFVCSVRW